ncbi:hypothetical protein [Cupriavidus basilensis]|uniref:Uncharacterized protein n=1 Tax=Cupriavidus basilensis TaxID=68895 RepID=A0A0C4YJ64_9BURK|nr:hypothetical protein [Cupriavidus basilensis]AJG21919.1 hypothetical protein RR42_s0323 [Cupriavidus basilensis]
MEAYIATLNSGANGPHGASGGHGVVEKLLAENNARITALTVFTGMVVSRP